MNFLNVNIHPRNSFKSFLCRGPLLIFNSLNTNLCIAISIYSSFVRHKMNNQTKILTLHPQGKKGVNISSKKYFRLKNYILEALEKKEIMTYEELFDNSIKGLQPTFEGKVGWYLVSVKLDLEAHGEIERIPKSSPHQLQLTKAYYYIVIDTFC